jgi:hypothetical protein
VIAEATNGTVYSALIVALVTPWQNVNVLPVSCAVCIAYTFYEGLYTS